MSSNFPDDPKLNYALFKLQDVLDAQRVKPHPDFEDIVSHREAVLARYQPIFHPSCIPELTKTDFESFLLYKNNHHWDGLQRVGKQMTANISLLREALGILLDESHPISERLNHIRRERI